VTCQVDIAATIRTWSSFVTVSGLRKAAWARHLSRKIYRPHAAGKMRSAIQITHRQQPVRNAGHAADGRCRNRGREARRRALGDSWPTGSAGRVCDGKMSKRRDVAPEPLAGVGLLSHDAHSVARCNRGRLDTTAHPRVPPEATRGFAKAAWCCDQGSIPMRVRAATECCCPAAFCARPSATDGHASSPRGRTYLQPAITIVSLSEHWFHIELTRIIR